MTQNNNNNNEDLELSAEDAAREQAEKQSAETYVDSNEEIFKSFFKDQVVKGNIPIYKEDSDGEANTELNTAENNDPAKPADAQATPEPQNNDLLSIKEQLKKEFEEQLKAERELFKAEYEKQQRAAIEAEQARLAAENEAKARKAAEVDDDAEFDTKLTNGLSKLLEGDASAVEEIKEALKKTKQPKVDVEEIIKKAKEEALKEASAEIARKEQAKEQEKEIIQFTDNYYSKHTELQNEAFKELFSNQINVILNSTEGSSLTLDSLYDKALTNAKSFAEKLGVKASPQASSNEEAEMKAKLEKAKNASITNTSAITASSTKPKEATKPASDRSIMESFLKVNSY